MLGWIIGFLVRWQYLILLGAAGAVIAWAYFKGRTDCADATLNKELVKMEKRNEIANNRPDTDAFFDGLLNDPNW